MQYFGFDRPSFGFKTFGFGDSFDPLTLFKDGKQGVWYDPSDKSTLFQDVAGTVPVTKDGDPVALMRDKSGNGNHAVQSVSTSRPIYKTDGILHWLAFDGVDDLFAIDVSLGINNIAAFAVKTPKSTDNFILGESSGSAKLGVHTSILFFRAVSGGDALSAAIDLSRTNIIVGGRNNAYTFARANKNEVKSASANSVSAVTNWSSLGTSGNQKFLGDFYGTVLINEYSLDTTQKIEQYLAQKAGVTL